MIKKLTSVRVEGFRGLSALNLKRLTTVNLFVGKNNTGKTTLLEAIRLLLSDDPRTRIYDVLTSRDEFSFRRLNGDVGGPDRGPPLAYESLFYGRPIPDSAPSFSIRGNSTTYAMDVQFVWVSQKSSPEEAGFRYILSDGPDADPEAVPGFQIHTQSSRSLLPVDRISRFYARRRLSYDSDPSVVFLPSSGMTMEEVGRVWDTIALTDEEDEVIDALRIIAPSLEKLVMVQSPEVRAERTLMAKLREFRSPVPFRSLGEGTVHLLSVILAMMKARGGVVLLDEIENGVHYSVQGELWTMIFRQASKLNTQVFATTHSWDCVVGFQQGGGVARPNAGALFRLEHTDNEINAVRFSVEEVAIADQESIEVR